MTATERIMVLWVPDWPMHALAAELETQHHPRFEGAARPTRTPPTSTPPPRALVAQHRVVACCPVARAAGVRTGMRERDAQATCPALELHPHDPERETRRFAPVIAALEAVVAGVTTLRPGLAALRARGPARYYGGEQTAAHAIAECVTGLGFTDVRIGVADGAFAAEQAARSLTSSLASSVTSEPHSGRSLHHLGLIPPGESRAFLAPFPVTRAAPERLATTLQGLGIHTLGAFAALPEDAVRQRFGSEGLACHQLAAGAGATRDTELRPQALLSDPSRSADFEPALNTGATLSEASAEAVSQLFTVLTEAALICTGLRVELTDDIGTRHERVWSHPTRFSPADVIDRIRWQAESGLLGTTTGSLSGPQAAEDRGGAGIINLTITATRTDRAAAHEAGLWGAEPDDRVRHHLRGVQSAHGQDSVGTAALQGNRRSIQRQQFTPWGLHSTDAQTSERQRRVHEPHRSRAPTASLPWPGALLAPTPSLVFDPPLPASLTDATGRAVGITPDDLLDASPAHLHVDTHPHVASHPGAQRAAASAAGLGHPTAITGWSSPWPLRERWWEGVPTRIRLQVVLSTGDAWLLFHETDRWLAEGKYD